MIYWKNVWTRCTPDYCKWRPGGNYRCKLTQQALKQLTKRHMFTKLLIAS